MSEKRKQASLQFFFNKKQKCEENQGNAPCDSVRNCEQIIHPGCCTNIVSSGNVFKSENKSENVPDAWPNVWTAAMWEEKKKSYPWIVCDSGNIGCASCSRIKTLGPLKSQGASVSKEWSSTLVSFNGNSRSAQLTSLRKKNLEHSRSFSHAKAETILRDAGTQSLEKTVDHMNRHEVDSTCKIFLTAYYIAKHDKPYTDHHSLLQLQKLNGAEIPQGLRSRFSATNIIDHVAEEMRLKVCKRILEIKGKISVLIDKSTTISSKSTLIVYLMCETEKLTGPHFLFLDLIELPDQSAQTITEQLLTCLKSRGFDQKYLQNNLVAFISDGASVMLGKKSGVAQRLLQMFPNIIVWHCVNHHLELAVGDVVTEVHGINNFRAFMDKLYSLYSQSPKNKRQLEKCAVKVSEEIKKFGRVLV